MNTIRSYGTKVQLWPCNSGRNQRWMIAADGTIHNDYNQWCLDADGGTIRTNGTKIQLWGCNHGYNQNWTRFAPNTSVPYLCRTYSTRYESVTLAFGFKAAICYNGSVVSPGTGNWEQPSCNTFGGSCTEIFGDTVGGGVEGPLLVSEQWDALVSYTINPGPPYVEFSPTSAIKVDRNGNWTASSTV